MDKLAKNDLKLLAILTLVVVGVFSFIYVVGNRRAFKAGECIVQRDLETWQEREVCQIEQLGKKRYKYICPTHNIGMLLFDPSAVDEFSEYFTKLEREYELTDCPFEQ